MAEPSEDVEVKISTEAAETFVNTYYSALNSPKGNTTSFYIKPTSTLKADICINGIIFTDPEAVQTVLDKQSKRAVYDVQSYDCNALNANYNVGAPDNMLGPDKDGKKMSLVVMVSGSVSYGKHEGEEEHRGFTESFILVPNWEAYNPKAAKGLKKWLISSQNFRIVL